MMIAYKYLSKPINLKNGVYHLVIENKSLFRKTLTALSEKDGDDWFVISENFNPMDLNKTSFFADNALLFEMNNKKLMTKIYSDLTQRANEVLYEEMMRLRSAILNFAEKLSFEFDFDYIYDGDIDASDIIKMLNFKVRNESEEHGESLMLFFSLLQKYLGIKLFICFNLNTYFSDEEISALSLMAESANISILNIESFLFNNYGKDRISIIDKDLCEIIDSEP